MIKKVTYLLLFTLSLAYSRSSAQTYGNEWINYSQTYYKFKIDTDRLYRISMSSLYALGMPNTVLGDNLQIFREGQEVSIFVSNNGVLTGADYIEFFGYRANAKVDEPLYKDVQWQLNPNQNLVSDSAFYFITFNNLTTNKRFALQSNNLNSPPAKELFFWDKFAKQYREAFNGGPSYEGQYNNPVLYLNSSQYENAEGWSKKTTVSNDSIVFTCLFPYTAAGPLASVKTTVVGNSYLSQHRIKVTANGNQIADELYPKFEFKRISTTIPMTYLTPLNKVSFKYLPQNAGLDYPDRYGIVSLEFRYPRLFNFNNSTSFYFELDPKPSDYYLEITNFNTGNVAPHLYDITDDKYLVGDIGTPGMVRFLIPGSNNVKSLLLQSMNAPAYASVAALQSVTFKNYTNAVNHGDYLIVSHSKYMDDGTGHNYLDDYAQYRNSAAGGNYHSVVADVQDIYNEFGYGYNFSPMAIRNFLHYASKSPIWTYAPKHAFFVGKGIGYSGYLKYAVANFANYPFYPIPSFGEPCSDVLYTDFDKNNLPQLSVGRLPAMNAGEIRDYLQKVKDHEGQVFNTSHQVSDSIMWRKKILHMAGTKSAAEQVAIVNSLNSQANIITKPFYGGNVTLVKKGSTTEVEDANSKLVDDLFNGGLSLLQFFGHSSSTGIDYNLDFPESYKNYKRYPVFIANGCSAGDIFILQGGKSLGERFVLAPISGSIAFIASVNTGYTNYLGIYTDSLYYRFSAKLYGSTLGQQIQDNVKSIMESPLGANNNSLRTHCEQIALNGDPATMLFSFPKPDYAVEEKGLIFKQLNLTTTNDSLDIDLVVYNLGRYTTDSVALLVTRTLPSNVVETTIYKKYPGIANTDTVHLKIPTYGDLGLGVNSLEVTIDNEGVIDEITEMNNSIKRIFNIYNDDLVPVYPYDLSIVTAQGVILKGSTLNPFATSKKYLLQIDTTALFNSPLMMSTTIESTGGVIKWQPTITLRDSAVYYWRTAMDTLYGNHFHRWSGHSFIYLNQGNEGWNQSHYYQLQKDDFAGVILDSMSRLIKYEDQNRKLGVQTVCLNGPSPYSYFFSDYLVKVNGSTQYTFGCPSSNKISYLQFVVIDTLTGTMWKNTKQGAGLGRFGSFEPCRVTGPNGIDKVDPFFEFDLATPAARNVVRAFMDSIPDGYYVMMQNRVCIGTGCGAKNATFIKQWMADTLLNGPNNSLYHKIKDFGFTMIDSFYKNRPFSFFMRKGMSNTIMQNVGVDSTVKLYAEYDFKSYLFSGTIATDKIGPAKTWTHLYKKGKTFDATAGDSVTVDIIGIDKNSVETVLSTNILGDTALSFIDANVYPFLRLKMNNTDNVHATPEQIKYWRVHYQPVPEAALNPNRYFTFKDTIGQGQQQSIALAIENLSPLNMDSLLVKFDIIDKNSNRTTIANKRYKPLPLLDTIHVDLDFNTSGYTGDNILVIEANPDNDQAEQFHPNNIGYRSFYVVGDSKNPLIDVTFDGVHIFDEDIVSAKPLIHITLKDENKFLALDDTSLISVFIKYPGENQNVEHYIPFDGNILKFIPASVNDLGTKNKATVEYRPDFVIDGNDYVLTVRAKDRIGNNAGNNAYKVRFRVINKPSISSVINYPNPFTTSTQFIFTITGSQLPSNLKIQILTPTGKVVREIVKSELGNLHIGRNITEYKWKGDDQYGQPLGNGVYLYRFVTNLNGTKMDHFETGTDKWIEKGFGKLYIMR